MKVIWTEDIILYNSCYMCFVENLLRRDIKRMKVIKEEISIFNLMLELSEAIKRMSKILYEREHVKKEKTIYTFDTMWELLEERDPALKNFLQQLYLAA